MQEVRSYFNRFGPNGAGQSQMEETTSCGSGVIFSMDDTYLYIVTNQHVVDGATTLSVSFVDNAVCEAQLCGTDADVDIAVLKVALSNLSADTLSQITVIPIGNSDELDVGEQVVAIGNALGYGQSVTTGIVSALDRTLTNESGTTSTYIQTDAAINPGNSGGALLNLDGELIGINTAKLSDTDVEGMGYAIPISDVVDLISELMTQTTDLLPDLRHPVLLLRRSLEPRLIRSAPENRTGADYPSTSGSWIKGAGRERVSFPPAPILFFLRKAAQKTQPVVSGS